MLINLTIPHLEPPYFWLHEATIIYNISFFFLIPEGGPMVQKDWLFVLLPSLSEYCGCEQKGQTGIPNRNPETTFSCYVSIRGWATKLSLLGASGEADTQHLYLYYCPSSLSYFSIKSFSCHISLLPQKCWSISLMKKFWIYVRFLMYVFLCKDLCLISRVYRVLCGIMRSTNVVLVRQLFVGFGSSLRKSDFKEKIFQEIFYILPWEAAKDS